MQICSSMLRRFASASWLAKLKEPTYIMNGSRKEPVAVLVPYETWQEWKQVIAAAMSYSGPGICHPDLTKLIEELRFVGRPQ